MREFLSKAFAPTFAAEFSMRLEPSNYSGERHWNRSGIKKRTWFACGLLPLKAHGETGTVKCHIGIFAGADWLEVPPIVQTESGFIKRDIDWHAYSDGRLCCILQQEWNDRLSKTLRKSNFDIAFVMDFAATWLLASTDSLITRHLIAARHGIDRWPPEWSAYGHGEIGVKEYERERRHI
jgi:hypothetical protein